MQVGQSALGSRATAISEQIQEQGKSSMQESNQMPPAQPNMDDEIDLRQYLDVLIAWRWEILAITVLAALVAAGVVLIQRAVTPPVYSATATLAIARTSRDIQFDENFRTTLDAENPASTRRVALVGLVASNAGSCGSHGARQPNRGRSDPDYCPCRRTRKGSRAGDHMGKGICRVCQPAVRRCAGAADRIGAK